ncbi:hypothetical protein NKR19_g5860 [Coniochaeta hoffmannii]|uniref:Mannosyltransferase putative-domain-containing protein n=1 Tax=Coniochaeta hoffmannii TaxID=91930 RepID=A0AA38VRV8_9PEZI|nr:hypothetical protein NKR19_g5860 [Coniochaeta hoffmannii]
MLQVASQGWTWLRSNTAKKSLFIIVATLLAANLSLIAISDSFRDRVRFWPVGGGSKSDVAGFMHVPDTPLNNSQFGERGNRVSQLGKWADLLIENAPRDTGLFEEALVRQFPFLGGALGSIYTPWSLSEKQSGGLPSHQPSYVICAGSKNMDMAAHLVRTLRRVLGSQVPIEIAYGGEEDLMPEHRKFLAELEPGVSFIDLLQRFPAARRDLVKSGWGMKPFALLAAASPRALLLDADAMFLTNPDSLFDVHPGLRRTGTLFFHDRAMRGGEDSRREWVRAQLEAAGRQPSRYLAEESLFYRGVTWWEQESGVVAVDRTNPRVFLGLAFAAWMNTKDVREEVTYTTFHGDKETFWLAMELAGFEYYFQPWYAGMLGTITDGEAGRDLARENVEVCGRHMVHLDHLGVPFWFNGGVYDNKDHPEGGYAELSHYLVGNLTGEMPQWYPNMDRGVACMNGVGAKPLPEEIKRNVQRMDEEAARVAEEIKKLS